MIKSILVVLCLTMLTGCMSSMISPHEAAVICDRQTLKVYKTYEKERTQHFECMTTDVKQCKN